MIQRFAKNIVSKKHQYFSTQCFPELCNPFNNFLPVTKKSKDGLPKKAVLINLQTSIEKRLYTKNSEGNSKTISCTKSQSECEGKSEKSPSKCRAQFRFHPETEAALNQQINAEFKAFYYYLSMAAYFGRVDVALPGCESFFLKMHKEEHQHALKILNYVKMRGGIVRLSVVNPPGDEDWKCPLHAFKAALDLEMSITEELVSTEAVAQKHGDLNTSDFIVTNFLEDQMKSVNEMAKFVTVLSGIGDQSLSRFLFDKDLLENHVSHEFNVMRNFGETNPEKKK